MIIIIVIIIIITVIIVIIIIVHPFHETCDQSMQIRVYVRQ